MTYIVCTKLIVEYCGWMDIRSVGQSMQTVCTGNSLWYTAFVVECNSTVVYYGVGLLAQIWGHHLWWSAWSPLQRVYHWMVTTQRLTGPLSLNYSDLVSMAVLSPYRPWCAGWTSVGGGRRNHSQTCVCGCETRTRYILAMEQCTQQYREYCYYVAQSICLMLGLYIVYSV